MKPTAEGISQDLRAASYSTRTLSRERKRAPSPVAELPDLPKRQDCRYGPRPCPHVRCRYHLLLDVRPSGTLKLTRDEGDIGIMDQTCALDVAEGGGATLAAIGELFGMTRERVRQLEGYALANLMGILEARGIDADAAQSFLADADKAPPMTTPSDLADRPRISAPNRRTIINTTLVALGLKAEDIEWLSQSSKEVQTDCLQSHGLNTGQ